MKRRMWQVEDTGGAPVLTEADVALFAADEVLVGIDAASLNFADLLMIAGTYQETPPLPFVPGMELAGRVLEVGADVTAFGTGDRVSAVVGSGALSTALAVKASACRKIPDSLDSATAAAFQIAYGTSHLALTRRARLAEGERLVVLGASGGVGLTAVEIGAALGAHVIAVARGEDKLAVAREAGAHVLIDAETPDILTAFRAEGPIDVVYDAVGGALGETALRALGPEGRHLLIGFASGDLPKLKPNHLLVKNVDVIGFYWGGYRAFAPDILSKSLDELTGWHAAGRINPQISHRFPFEEAPDALDLLKSRRSTGKVVVEMTSAT